MYHPRVGKIKVVGSPVKYSYAENCVRSPPPALGEHTEEILTNLLNYSIDKIQILDKDKIIQREKKNF